MARQKRKDEPKLSAAEKRERDARAQHWMNQRKIERVADAAARSGWHTMTEQFVDEWLNHHGYSTDGDGELVFDIPDVGRYRIYGYDPPRHVYIVRKIESFEERDDAEA